MREALVRNVLRAVQPQFPQANELAQREEPLITDPRSEPQADQTLHSTEMREPLVCCRTVFARLEQVEELHARQVLDQSERFVPRVEKAPAAWIGAEFGLRLLDAGDQLSLFRRELLAV